MRNLKKRFNKIFDLKSILTLFVVSMLLTSCNKNDDQIMNPIFTDTKGIDLGANIQRDFMGKIVDESNLPIENVIITIGTKNSTTDENGMFIIKKAEVKSKHAYITAKKTGYLKGMKTLIPTQGINTTRIMLITENIIATVASGSDSEVDLPNGTKVKFDGSFKDENGNAYSGNIDVILYHLDPSDPDIEDKMPGMLQAQNENEEERVLESYGMINVELKGSAGQLLNIADGHVAEIEIPIDPAQSGVAPTTIPLWHFDEAKGYWVEDGYATAQGGKYVGEVSHFSWWNCDAQFPTVILCLNVVDANNIPLSSAKVELWRSGAIYPRIGISDANGEICGLIPSNETLTLKAFDQCMNIVYTTTIGPFSSNTNLGNVVLPTITAATITGNLVDCSSNNVTNGYVTLAYGMQEATAYISNGSFSLNVIQCPSLPTFDLEGIDYDSFQTTGSLSFNFSNTNLGNLIACNAVTEYISVQVDNNPAEYYLNNISAGSSGIGNNSFVVGAKNANGQGFYVGGETNIPGTYDSNNTPKFWIEGLNLDMNYNLPDTIQYTLTTYGAIGQYINMNFSGSYTDNSGNTRNVTGTVHAVRDN